MSPKGDFHARLGQVLLDRERWKASAEALSTALAKGGLTDPGTANLMLGMANYYRKRSAQAKKYFSRALRDDSSRESASQWLLLLDREMAAKAEERERESEVTPEIEAKQEGSAPPAVEGLPDNEIS